MRYNSYILGYHPYTHITDSALLIAGVRYPDLVWVILPPEQFCPVMDTLQFPPEVLSEIFLNSLDLQLEVGYLPRIHPDAAPVLLTRVCRYWRNVALSSPRLWSRMLLPSLPPTLPQRNSLLKRIPFWLSLSGSLPLSITLRISGRFPALAPRYATLLCGESHRWESMRLHLGLVKIETLPPVGSLEILREFLYEGNTNKVGSVIPPFLTSFASAPRLRTVIINNDMAWTWALPWTNLTSLKMVCETAKFPPDVMRRVCESLQACACLEFLDIRFTFPYDGEPPLPSRLPVVFPQLMQFSLNADLPEIIGSFMNMFDMPRLDVLSLTVSEFRRTDDAPDPHGEIMASILSFLARNGDQIDRLYLEIFILPDPDLVRILQRVPNIQVLDIKDEDVTPLIWNALTIHYDSQGRVQAGQNLRLTDISCVASTRYLGNRDYTQVVPCLPLSVDAAHGAAGSLGVPGTATGQITFAGEPLPAENRAPLDELQYWLAKVSNPEFSISFARMIQSRWALPPDARAEGQVAQLTGMRLVHFDLHIVEVISRDWYTALLRSWEEGLRLSVWCSLKRQAYWRQTLNSGKWSSCLCISFKLTSVPG